MFFIKRTKSPSSSPNREPSAFYPFIVFLYLYYDFDIIHNPYPNKYHFEVIRELVPFINEKYCMYICDDDILVVSTLIKCVKFLELNTEYSAVGGVAIKCNIDILKTDNHFKITSTKIS